MKSKAMIMFIVASAICMFVLAAPTGFCGGRKEQVAGCEKTHKDSAYSADGKVGQVFEILLDSNPATSSQWQLVSSPDEKVLKFIGSHYRPPITRMAGPGGKAIWTFKALSPGRAVIVFGCLRPREKDGKPTKCITVTINVR
ncbi:MAG: Chagasin family peptidase inhibitor I42 [Syntrophorhabdus sp. PtaU1.Bin002]|nr:MAG: Chagasin family peptidase inhibitor I42 [Syntrophorhabdus sp. PtaB.Bin006]OPY66429.1 MAG: Chagasin family peptidase inhibitor I42 [Syntrophorhabdus sp. PtaU1.Bin002]